MVSLLRVVVLLLLIAQAGISHGSEEGLVHINLILDASGSMWDKAGKGSTRIEEAKKALNSIIDSLAERKGFSVGLRVYGHRTNKCDDTKLEIPIGPLDAKRMKKFISEIKPKGKTPIALSLEEGAKDFSPSFDGKKIIILVTDGLESCGGDPCKVAKTLAEKGVVSKIHVVGFGLDKKSIEALKCIPSPSGGMLIEAKDASEIVKAFDKIVQSTVGSSLEVHGVDGKGRSMDLSVVLSPGDLTFVGTGIVSEPVEKGTFQVKATANATGETVEFRDVKIEEGKTTSLKAVFQAGLLKIQALDKEGRIAPVFGRVSKSDDPSVVHDFGGQGECALVLRPGKYEIEIFPDGSRPGRKGQAELEDGKTTVSKFSFGGDSGLSVTSRGYRGSSVYFGVKASDTEGGSSDEAWSDNGKVALKLAPGTYDVEILSEKPGFGRILSGIRLDEGAIYAVEIPFSTGEILFKGKVAHVTFRFVDEERDIVIEQSSESNGTASFLLPAGVYNISTVDVEGNEGQFLNVAVKEDQSVTLEM